MIIAENSEIAVKLRKYKTELYTAGAGYIMFGVWSVIKIVMTAFLDSSLKSFVTEQNVKPEDYPFILAIFIVLLSISVIGVMLIHLYVGLGAIRASRDGKKKGYLICARLMFALSIIVLLLYFLNFRDLSNLNIEDTAIASFLVDLTVTVLLFGMIRAARMIKKLSA